MSHSLRAKPMNKRRGSELPWATITEDDARLIRGLLDHREKLMAELKTLSSQAIADKFGITKRTVESISQGLTWNHIT